MSRIVVVKLGGTTVAGQENVLAELAALARRRPLVVVHGGGLRVNDWLARLGVPTRFEDGLRVTDEATLEVATAVLRGAINVELVAALRRLGADAVGLSGVDGGLLVAERLPGKGFVASVVDVRRTLLDALIVDGRVPVVAPLALDERGVVCNVNADDVAAGIARGLGAARLVLLTDVDGIRDASGARLASIAVADAERLIADGVIGGGMIPKVRSALRAVSGAGADEVVIADGSISGAVERALSDPDFGTRIAAAPGPKAPAPAETR